MAVKYRLELKRDHKQSWRIIGSILLTAFIANIIISLLNQMEDMVLASWLSVGVLIILTIVTLKIVKHTLYEYEYILTHNALKINKMLGKKIREIYDIQLNQIEYILSQDKLKKDPSFQKKIKRRRRYSLSTKAIKNEVFVGYFKEEGEWSSFSFQPDEKMLTALEKQIGKDKIIRS